MKTTPNHLGVVRGLGRAAGTISLAAALVLVGGSARAQNITALTLVPEHVYLVRGGSFRNGDLLTIEPSALLFFGPIAPPVAMVARGIVGIGGSGGGIGFAANLVAPSACSEMCPKNNDDFFMGPFVSLEARVERTYVQAIGWRHATYAGPQLSLSFFVLKASVGWMVDVTDRANTHVQVGVGAGF